MSKFPQPYKFPPRCIRCGEVLPKASVLVCHGYLPCPTCPPNTRVVHYLQDTRGDYPAGWPLCPWCGSPVLDGKPTCGNLVCNVKEREEGLKGG